MPRDRNETKRRILEAVQAQVMEKGFAAVVPAGGAPMEVGSAEKG